MSLEYGLGLFKRINAVADRRELTPEIINSLAPPEKGERWIADTALKGFGVRLWANSKKDGLSYSVRVRDSKGVLRRESFSPWSDWHSSRKLSALLQQGIWEFEWGIFLEDARRWAAYRIDKLKEKVDLGENRYRRARMLSEALQAMSLEQTADRTLSRMDRRKRKNEYIDQIRKLFWRISDTNRKSTLMDINVRKIAADIADPNLPIMQSRALQAFVGQLYSNLYRWHGPAGRVSDAINERISYLRSKQKVPYPEILEIPESDFEKFLSVLVSEGKYWREALAIRVYFGTGAKMRTVLRIQWSEIIDGKWYPYSPNEREYWFMGIENLDIVTQDVLALAKDRLSREGRSPQFVFPRIDDALDRPITNVRRYWLKISNRMGWDGLPLSHVVQRHHQRNTPSYLHMYRYMFVPMRRHAVNPDIVSKLVKSEKFDA